MQYIERPLLQVIANASLGAVKELWHLICRSVAMHLPEESKSRYLSRMLQRMAIFAGQCQCASRPI